MSALPSRRALASAATGTFALVWLASALGLVLGGLWWIYPPLTLIVGGLTSLAALAATAYLRGGAR